MAVEGGAKCVKYLLFFFNFIFWLCGLALLVLGIIVQFTFKAAVASKSSAPALVLIVVGVIIFFIAFFGCCGAWKENYCMVTMFAVLLSLIIIAEIAVAILGYVYRKQVTDVVNDSLQLMIDDYKNKEELKKAIDGLQTEFKCCGSNSSDDWRNFTSAHNSVPDSCCKNVTKDCGVGAIHDGNKIYTEGCQPAVVNLLKKGIMWVAVAAIVIALIQITGIVLACILMRGIHSGYEVM